MQSLGTIQQGVSGVAQRITWYGSGAVTPADLTGATITATIESVEDPTYSEASDGSVVLIDAPNGVFSWTPGVTDTGTPGKFYVIFTATTLGYSAKTLRATLDIEEATFHYNPGSGADRDRVRAAINDVKPGFGPLPEGENFTDAEIADLVTVEGTWQRAVAGALERLAAAWRVHPSWQADGLTISNSHISRGFADEAKRWRETYGKGGTVRSTTLTRTDGFYYEYNQLEEV